MLYECLGKAAALVGAQASVMHQADVVRRKSVTFLGRLTEVLVGFAERELDFIRPGRCYRDAREVEGAKVVLCVDAAERCSPLEVLVCFLVILAYAAKQFE